MIVECVYMGAMENIQNFRSCHYFNCSLVKGYFEDVMKFAKKNFVNFDYYFNPKTKIVCEHTFHKELRSCIPFSYYGLRCDTSYKM